MRQPTHDWRWDEAKTTQYPIRMVRHQCASCWLDSNRGPAIDWPIGEDKGPCKNCAKITRGLET